MAHEEDTTQEGQMSKSEAELQDPLDIATDLLYETLSTLTQTSVTADRRDSARNAILLIQATAQIDIARSLREIREMMSQW